jgi:RNA polymerase sigma-70 factor (ECF subfamily)
MSTAVISFGAEVGILESASVQLNDSVPWFAMRTPDAPIAKKASEMAAPGFCYDAACEIQLVSAAKAGDQRAFAELCRRHIPSLKRRIRRIIRNREDSEDILQDTLLSAYKHLSGFRAKSSFQSWIMTIATNNSLILLRKRRNHPETGLRFVTTDGKEVEILEVSDSLPNPEEVYAKRQASHRVAQAVRLLPPVFRQVVERYHQDEVRLVEAANAIGITVAAAKSRLSRARNVLRRRLQNDYALNSDC